MRKFSFVILNDEKTLELICTLKSLNRQEGYDKDDYEVIVVDTSPFPYAYKAIKNINETYELHYNFIGRDNSSNIMEALNLGWKKAAGEIIIFLESNVIVNNDFLIQVNKGHSISNRLLIIGINYYYSLWNDRNEITKVIFNDNNNVLEEKVIQSPELKFLIKRYSNNVSHCLYPWFLVPACNISIKKIWLKKVNGFNTEYNFKKLGFMDLGYRFCNEGGKIILNSHIESVCQDVNSQLEANNLMSSKYLEDINCFYLTIARLNLSKVTLINILEQKKKWKDILFCSENKSYKKIINFKNRENLQKLKAVVIESININDTEVIINDYLNDPELEIWIQILGKGKCVPKYFPVQNNETSDISDLKGVYPYTLDIAYKDMWLGL